MSAPPPASTTPAPQVPLLVWVLGLSVLGGAFGYLRPWETEATPAFQRDLPAPAVLVAQLEDPAARTGAYLRLLELREAAVEPLLAAVERADHGGRAEAVELLGRIGDPRALPVVLGLDDPALAHPRIVALGQLRGPEALEAVLGALDGERVELHFPALGALREWPELPPAALARARAYLTHHDPGLRELAARLAGRQRDAGALELLVPLLGDAHAPTRQSAAWALMQLGAPEGVAAVESAIATGAVVYEQ